MTHGVTPRVHGNHGKKPHNVFPLDTYTRATEFLKSYIEKYNVGSRSVYIYMKYSSLYKFVLKLMLNFED